MSYYSTYKNIVLKLQNAYRPLIYACLQEQIDAFIVEYKRNQNAIPTDLPTQPLYDTLMNMYQSGGITMANVTQKEIKRQVKKDDNKEEESLWDYIIRKYYELFLMADIVQPITNTTFNQIKRILLQGQDEGWGIKEMVDALKHSDITRQRAELIVRTESMRATNVGAMVGAAGSKIALVKQWISAQDNRTRRIPRDQFDHLHMNGVAVGFDLPFIVPSTSSLDAMQYPGDPNGSAGNVCNCRCVVAFVPIRDGQGRPVPVEEYRAQNQSEFRQLYLEAQINRNIFA